MACKVPARRVTVRARGTTRPCQSPGKAVRSREQTTARPTRSPVTTRDNVPEATEAATVAHALTVLRADFPDREIWREDDGGHVRYIARGQHPHTVVTADLGELRTALSGASAQSPKAAKPDRQPGSVAVRSRDAASGPGVRLLAGVQGPLSGRPPGRPAGCRASSAGSGRRAGEPGVPRPRGAVPGRATRGAPVHRHRPGPARRPAPRTLWPRRSPPSPAWCTRTTTRWCWRTPARCSPAPVKGDASTSTATCATPRRS